jgi:hypothetical protein
MLMYHHCFSVAVYGGIFRVALNWNILLGGFSVHGTRWALSNGDSVFCLTVYV